MSETDEAASFNVTGHELGPSGIFLVIPEHLPVKAGMGAWNWTHGSRAPERLILDVVTPSDLKPAILVADAGPNQFHPNDRVVMTDGNHWGNPICMQGLGYYLLEDRGLVVHGRVLKSIEQGQWLSVRGRKSVEYRCQCVGMDRFEGGLGQIASPGERGVGILLRLDAEIWPGDPAQLTLESVGEVLGDYPSLHAQAP